MLFMNIHIEITANGLIIRKYSIIIHQITATDVAIPTDCAICI